jgi:hypothetical protein
MRNANIVLGLLGVLLAGIEIGKSAVGGDLVTAYTLAVGLICALLTGNVDTVLRSVAAYYFKPPVKPPAEPPDAA